ncbi:MAG: hypothetical protein JW940_13435 [Polyangiaceae bacterium]|nr:hypothetical protein [Polyangiaceae bacterium]
MVSMLSNTRSAAHTACATRVTHSLVAGAFGLAVLACGSAPPANAPPVQPAPAAQPAAAPAAAEPPVSSESPSSPSESATEPAAPAEPPKAAEPALPRSPRALLVARDVAFLVEYDKSEAKTKAEADCEKKSKGDEAKRTACVEKAKKNFLADVVRFVQNDQGACTVTIYKRTGDNLAEIFRGPVTLTDEPPDKVRAEFAKGKGSRPLFRGAKSGTILVPDDYSIEIDDPLLGKLYYSAKIGLVTDGD